MRTPTQARSRGAPPAAPIAYLTGSREFWSLPLNVTPAVLVPRPETETLVERALALLPARCGMLGLDLGTGSGAIALEPRARAPALGGHGRRYLSRSACSRRAKCPELESGAHSLAVGLLVRRRAGRALRSDRRQPTLHRHRGPGAREPARRAPHRAASRAPRDSRRWRPSSRRRRRICVRAAGWHWNMGRPGADVARLLETRGFFQACTYPDAFGKPRVTLASIQTQH